MKIYDKITQLIGNTPLLRLNSIEKSCNAKSEIIAKLECFNPCGSAKDRVGFYMLTSALERGEINSETLIIEPTSGNTGIGLASSCASLGFKCVITMPSSMSKERIKIMTALGAQVVLTDKDKGMKGAIEKAEEIKKDNPNSFIVGQFSNPDNPKIHEITTANEILNDTDGKIDYFIASIGTGGSISGIGKALKKALPNVKIIGVEPASSPLITKGYSAPHKIQGIGANFIPDNFDTSVVDEIITISDEEAILTARQIGKEEGVLVGYSSGAVVAVAKQIAQKTTGKRIVTLCPDGGEKYLSCDLFE